MKRTIISLIAVALLTALYPTTVNAGADLYAGDTTVYGGSPLVLQPNVLIIIDTSGSMDEWVPGGSYDPSTDYTPASSTAKYCKNSSGTSQVCIKDDIYDSSSPPKHLDSWVITNLAASCSNGDTPRSDLQNYGIYTGRQLDSSTTPKGKTCKSSGIATYKTGNYVNFLNTAGTPKQKIEIAKSVVKNLVATTHNVRFGLMRYHNINGNLSGSKGGQFLAQTVSGSTYTTTIQNMDDVFTTSSGTTNRYALMSAVSGLDSNGYTPLAETLYEAMQYYKGGTSAFGNTIGIMSGGTYSSPIVYSCQNNYIVFVTDGMSTADDSSVLDNICTSGDCDGDGNEPGNSTLCDPGNNGYGTRCHSLDDVAKYIHDNDLRTDQTGTQSLTFFAIGFGFGTVVKDQSGNSLTYDQTRVTQEDSAKDLLTRATDSVHGNGEYFNAGSETELADAFTTVLSKIFETNASFVAPVVPVSPENKTYSGTRVYMGFFRPETAAFWSGNLKKYRLGVYTSPTTGVVLDSAAVYDVNGRLANYVDNNADTYDDRDGAHLPPKTQNGAFRTNATDPTQTSQSFWSTSPDGGEVDQGGAGEVLLNRDYTLDCATCDIVGTNPRKIYTFMGNYTDLTNANNAFSTVNTAITATVLGLGLTGSVITSATTTDVRKLINYVHGFNTYNDNTHIDTWDKRSWILGDILHSKPKVISYNVYDYVANPSSESDCNVNKTMIYAGANDGMLHVFKDCDGSEAWAFIPPELLPNLQNLRGNAHPYFVDSTVSAYIYQTDPNATSISSSAGDKVVIVVGLRRGGGLDSEPTKGYYYALDVTDPMTPTFLWSISNTTRWRGTTKTATTDFSDLGEAWSEPKIVPLKGASNNKIAVFIGGGYDNCNEDARFGANQNFTGTCVGATTDDGGLNGSGNPKTSPPAGSGSLVTSFTSTLSYKGRAIYAVELARLGTTPPSPDLTTNGGGKIWGYSNTSAYSIISELTAIDANYDGYVDRIYAGDTGGNLWRINALDPNPSNWAVTQIFDSNPGYTADQGAGVLPALDGTTGRKIFYKPSVAIDSNIISSGTMSLQHVARIFFGTGDREHPLNRAVTDRIYGLIDKGQSAAVTEANLLDVSTNLMQNGTQAQVSTMTNLLGLASSPTGTYYGWYMRIYGAEHYDSTTLYQGEKVLAPSLLMNNVVYFTTYAPSTASTTTTDPCAQAANLGIARLYALDYYSGMAALNLDTGNESATLQWSQNSNAKNAEGKILLRTDRTINLGSGIPSGVQPSGLVGCGGGLCKQTLAPGGQVQPLYWRQSGCY